MLTLFLCTMVNLMCQCYQFGNLSRDFEFLIKLKLYLKISKQNTSPPKKKYIISRNKILSHHKGWVRGARTERLAGAVVSKNGNWCWEAVHILGVSSSHWDMMIHSVVPKWNCWLSQHFQRGNASTVSGSLPALSGNNPWHWETFILGNNLGEILFLGIFLWRV